VGVEGQAPIGPFIADFVCHRARLVIEVDGRHHADRQAAEARRTAWLAGRGFRVLRFGNEAVLTNIDGVIAAIAAAIAVAAAPPTYTSPAPRGRERLTAVRSDRRLAMFPLSGNLL
jgi:very-short-patch-repair endonuclease